MISTLRVWIAAAATVSVVAGCSAPVAGRAVKAPGPASGVDLALLDPGNYPTRPQPPLGIAGDAKKGAWQEARRMADDVVGPWQADPSLLDFVQMDTGVVNDPASELPNPLSEGVADHHFVTGFSSGRQSETGPNKGLTHTVFRFASPQDAAAAATDMASKATTLTPTPEDTIHTTPMPIPRHPDTTAATYDFDFPDYTNGGRRDEIRHTVIAITDHGPYVFFQWGWTVESSDLAAQTIANILDLQAPLIDKFHPTPVGQLAQLPLDPSGLLARTMPPPRDEKTTNDGVYTPAGALHFEANPVRAQALFASAGLQQAAYTVLTTVYRTPDTASATRVADMLASDAADANMIAVPGVSGVPAGKCFRTHKDPYKFQAIVCDASADRYAFRMQADHEVQAHQLIAAQYLMLTAK